MGWQFGNVQAPIVNKLNLINKNGSTILTGGNFNSSSGGVGFLPVTKTGYAFNLELQVPGAATTPFVQLDIFWYDSTTNRLVDHQNYTLPCGTSPANMEITGNGPTRGDLMIATITNFSNSTVTFSFSFNLVSNSYITDRVYQFVFGVPVPTFSNPGSNPAANYIAFSSIALGISASATRLIPFYVGNVKIHMNSSLANQYQIIMTSWDQTLATPPNELYNNTRGSGGAFEDFITLPRSSCQFQIVNGGTAQTVTFSIIVEEQWI